MKQIFFCPDQWRMDATVPTGVAAITEVTGFDGKTTEAWQLGNWQYDWSTIRTDIVLEPGEEYTFVFWLNGGENDQYDEVCNLEVFGEGQWDERQTFRLNRGFIKPLKYKNGWYLMAVPFTAPAADKVTLRFNAMRAVTTIAPAEEPAQYEELISDPENYDQAQRSNVVFENGWPEPGEQPVLHFEVNNSDVSITKAQLKKAALVAGGAVAGALILRRIFRKKP